jgi:hypothetical protein
VCPSKSVDYYLYLLPDGQRLKSSKTIPGGIKHNNNFLFLLKYGKIKDET